MLTGGRLLGGPCGAAYRLLLRRSLASTAASTHGLKRRREVELRPGALDEVSPPTPACCSLAMEDPTSCDSAPMSSSYRAISSSLGLGPWS
jgi:hypothetical protein